MKPRYSKGTHVGYGNLDSYRVYVSELNEVIISRDVTFNEYLKNIANSNIEERNEDSKKSDGKQKLIQKMPLTFKKS